MKTLPRWFAAKPDPIPKMSENAAPEPRFLLGGFQTALISGCQLAVCFGLGDVRISPFVEIRLGIPLCLAIPAIPIAWPGKKRVVLCKKIERADHEIEG